MPKPMSGNVKDEPESRKKKEVPTASFVPSMFTRQPAGEAANTILPTDTCRSSTPSK